MSVNNMDRNPPLSYERENSSLATVSLVAGIVSFFIAPLLGGIVAVVTGTLAKKEIRESGARIMGEDYARWGVILGWVNIGLTVLAGCLVLLMVLGVTGFLLWSIPQF